MRISVVDASAFGALVFAEPRARDVAETLSETTMVAPALLWFEIASTCLKKIKAHLDLTQQRVEALKMARRLPVEIIDIDHAEVIELAVQTDLTSYDASYYGSRVRSGGVGHPG
jgi:predicted nucleic acid-binding protein